MDRAFAEVVRDRGRDMGKPRSRGRTAVLDPGLSVEVQGSWLRMAAAYVDEAKIMTGTASLYTPEYLREKLAVYREHRVRPFLGGFFLERVFADNGIDGAARYFDEALAYGFGALEVSSTTFDIAIEERATLVRLAREKGLEVHGEIGSQSDVHGIDSLIAEAKAYLEAGSDVVIVEGAELMRSGRPNAEFCARVSSELNLEKVYFELGGPWVKETHAWQVRALRTFLFDYFGPNVNLANVHLADIIETETFRWALGE